MCGVPLIYCGDIGENGSREVRIIVMFAVWFMLETVQSESWAVVGFAAW